MVKTRRQDGVLEILLNYPPVNALGSKMRQEVYEAVEGASADEAIRAVVIRSEGKLFSAGADISEFGKEVSGLGLAELVNRIEASEKPIIAAIHGACLGGGLEIALGCHYRLTAPSARLGLPEVKLGLLPGAGGTQRLPRLIGAKVALDMIVFGDPISAVHAMKFGLVDGVSTEETLVAEAIAFARNVSVVRRTGELSAAAEPGIFESFVSANIGKMRGLEAPAACVEAVRGATTLPFREGLDLERALFVRLMHSEQSRALRHIFFAERAAGKVVDIPKTTQLRLISKVGVIGAGTMGGGIAMNFLSAGIPVTLVEMAQEALDRGVAVMQRNYDAGVLKGKLTEAQVSRAMSKLSPTVHFSHLEDCDLIIEAVYENMEVKLDIFKRLNVVAKRGAMLASNTSYLNIDEMAAVTDRPQDVLGTHFFSPANVMKLVEVVRGAATAPDAIATAMDLARRVRKVPVVSRVTYGFIGNRMLIPRQEQATELLLDGASPDQIDGVHTAFGMPMGPFQMTDLAGVDIGWHRDASRITSVKDALCAAGRWGQKTKGGFYDYDEQRRPTPSPVTQEILKRFRAQAERPARVISEEEILVRTLYTMINEGAKILEEGIAQRASDIDVVWVFGYGWPAGKGGPMFWAERLGLRKVVEGLESYRPQLGPHFTISALLAARAAEGRSLSG